MRETFCVTGVDFTRFSKEPAESEVASCSVRQQLTKNIECD